MGTLLRLHTQVPTEVLTAVHGTAGQAWGPRWHCTTSLVLAESPDNAAPCSTAPRLAASIRKAASSPMVLEHLMDPITRLTAAWISPRQPQPRRVPVEVQPWHFVPCTGSEMLGSPDKSLHFCMRAEGAQSSQAVPSSQNTCRASLCKPTQKQGSPYKPRMSLSLGSCINLPWPAPALASQCEQWHQQLRSEHLLCLWGKLSQGSYMSCPQAQQAGGGARALGSRPWSTGLLSP